MSDSILPSLKGPTAHHDPSGGSGKRAVGRDVTLGFLCFTVDKQEFGIDLNLIQKIVKPPPVTWVPRLPPHILGIISIRGAVVTLVDLRQFMDMSPTLWPKTTRVLIVELNDEPLGLLVDSVTQVRRIDSTDLEADPPMVDGPCSDYVSFAARPSGGDPVFMLDLDTILSERMR